MGYSNILPSEKYGEWQSGPYENLLAFDEENLLQLYGMGSAYAKLAATGSAKILH